MSEPRNPDPASADARRVAAPATPPPHRGFREGQERPPTSADIAQKFAGLQDARRAALNLMEDAVEARNTAEALNEALRDSTERLTNELNATRQLQTASAQLVEDGDNHALYQIIVDTAAAIMRSDGASFQCLDHSGNALRLLAWHGFDAEFGRIFELCGTETKTACSLAAHSGQRVIVPDVETFDFIAATPALEDHRRMGIRAVQSTPLFSRDGHWLGMISTHWGNPHTPGEDDLRRFDILARQAADLMERKQAEDALRESERRFRGMIDALPAAIYTTDAEGRITHFNPAAVEFSGRVPELGTDQWCVSFRLYHADGSPMPHDECPMAIALKGGRIVHSEAVLERPDGTRRCFVPYPTLMFDSQGRVTGGINMLMDITEQKRASEQLRRAFEFDEAVVTNMSEGLYTVDRHGLVTSMNPAAEAIFGWRFEELRGRRMHDITHHHHPDGTRFPAEECAGFRVLRTGEPVIGHEDLFIRKDGGFFPVVFSAAPLRDSENVIGVVVVFRDITERKAAQERERLLAREIAHRSKNLLNVIQAIVFRSLSGTRTLAEGREAAMQRIQALARSMNVLETGGFESAPISEIVRLEAEGFSDRVSGTGPELRLNPKAAQTLALVVHELVTNATKYGALSLPGGRVAVNWSITGQDDGAKFSFQWQEAGGPTVASPTRHGFGRVLIGNVAAQEFGTEPKISFAPEGLGYEIEAPLSSIVAGGTDGSI